MTNLNGLNVVNRSSKKQVKYANKMVEAGFVTVRSWVPEEKKEELRKITKAWRDEKKDGEKCEK